MTRPRPLLAMRTRETLVDSYNRLAEAYAEKYCRELEHKPFDRQLLERFVRDVPPRTSVCDMGCGPGHVARFLEKLEVDVFGIDLAPGMVDVARRMYPSIEFRVADMLASSLDDESLGGIVAFYSVIHLSREQVPDALVEMERVLVPGGRLLVSFHRGQGALHDEESLGKPVAFDCTLFEPEFVRRTMEEAGLVVEMVAVRTPYDFEYPTTRVYAWGVKPGS